MTFGMRFGGWWAMSNNLTAVSLFAGVGGFDLALERAGVKVIASVEIDKKASSILARHFPNSKLFSDVKEVTGEQLISAGFIPERGIITGGFPCQDVSVAGKRAGLTGVRTGLFWEIIRLLKETKAQYFILENVPGLLSSNEGRDMGTVLRALAELGYRVAYRVLDAQHFGVPQRRRRVFIVGSLGDSGAAPSEILAIAQGRAGYLEASQQKGKTVAGKVAGGADPFIKIIRSGARAEDGSLPAEVWAERDIAPTLSAFDNGGESRATVLIIDGTRVNDVRVYEDEIAPTVVARYGTGGNNVPAVFPIQDGREIEKYKNGVGVADEGNPSYTLDQTGSQSVAVFPIQGTVIGRSDTSGPQGKGYADNGEPMFTQTKTDVHAVAINSTVRRLTPMECERLQGFEDGWTDEQADSNRYKQMGNAVAVPVVEWIVNRLVGLANVSL
jgi:DNA (cytosine-5)-methyltransferase 1